jgi:hypothetical protein
MKSFFIGQHKSPQIKTRITIIRLGENKSIFRLGENKVCTRGASLQILEEVAAPCKLVDLDLGSWLIGIGGGWRCIDGD